MKAIVLAILLGAAGQAAAAPPTLSDPELAAQRGGLQTPNGFEIGFAATVRTYVDGQLALETHLAWTDQGVQTARVDGAGQALASPPGTTFTATIPGSAGGTTQVSQDFSPNRIANVVLNTASGRTIRQDTDITLVVPQLADLQRQAVADRMAASLQSALGTALRTRSAP
jgi:hypothetical protein